MKRHQCETITVYNDKKLKKASLDLIAMQLIRQPSYYCDIQHFQITRVMTNNTVQGLIKFLVTQYNL